MEELPPQYTFCHSEKEIGNVFGRETLASVKWVRIHTGRTIRHDDGNQSIDRQIQGWNVFASFAILHAWSFRKRCGPKVAFEGVDGRMSPLNGGRITKWSLIMAIRRMPALNALGMLVNAEGNLHLVFGCGGD